MSSEEDVDTEPKDTDDANAEEFLKFVATENVKEPEDVEENAEPGKNVKDLAAENAVVFVKDTEENVEPSAVVA